MRILERLVLNWKFVGIILRFCASLSGIACFSVALVSRQVSLTNYLSRTWDVGIILRFCASLSGIACISVALVSLMIETSISHELSLTNSRQTSNTSSTSISVSLVSLMKKTSISGISLSLTNYLSRTRDRLVTLVSLVSLSHWYRSWKRQVSVVFLCLSRTCDKLGILLSLV